MGEIADQVIEGFLCEICTCFIDGDSPGFPRKCNECKPKKRNKKRKSKNKVGN